MQDIKDFVSLRALERETGISRRTISRMLAAHGKDDVPFITLARDRRYSRTAILEMLNR